MCQCILCDCWWCNWCGVCCAGWADHELCCSCWICKPDDLLMIDPECCHCCDGCAGYGGNFFCQGSICCAPDWVRNWSKFKSSGQMPGNNGPQVVIYQQQGGVPQYEGGYQPQPQQQQGYQPQQQQGYQQPQGGQQQGDYRRI